MREAVLPTMAVGKGHAISNQDQMSVKSTVKTGAQRG
jgi:hypothetical protein